MKTQHLALAKTHKFSSVFLDYTTSKFTLSSFYSLNPKVENFMFQLANKQFSNEQRQILYDSVLQQYKGVANPPDTLVKLLDNRTFTVTTGHQLSIFTGELYFIYKIITVINTAKELQKQNPNFSFVPVFWLASEDHDFAEIAHFHLFGKKYEWQPSFEPKGAAGRLSTKGLEEIIAQIPEMPEIFAKAYQNFDNLAQATRYLVNELFGKYGVVVVDGDSPALKQQLRPTMKADILQNKIQPLVQKTDTELAQIGYEKQIHAREINFFWLDNNIRERIVKEGDRFKVLNTDLQFSQKEIEDLIENSPEKFSPNVVLRPLYQEIILPNISYTGGPAETVYWLQLKRVFDFSNIQFPILLPRNFVALVNEGTMKKVEKLKLNFEDLFLPENQLKTKVWALHSDIPISLEDEKILINTAFDLAVSKAVNVDATLKDAVNAERHKALLSLENLGKKIKKSQERNLETVFQQLNSVLSKILPNNQLQERYENILSYYINRPTIIDELCESLNPFAIEFNIVHL